ncbi:hypothetical protein [Sphingobacterium sp. SYP-B4668]|uniref:hypothetical protein n=1 Tax=Sphingobacterium sp. SYP-B4668 TaxID=2996035 RepID=UPI0022DD7997|nr:hypothetical protein [Sphingobacterium sp. SYP-B4668]
MELYLDKVESGDLFHTSKKSSSILSSFLVGIIVSCYFFPFELYALPEGLNTKIMLAAVGIALLGFDVIQRRSLVLKSTLLPLMLLALLFSMWGYIAMDINHSHDDAYASYWISFSTWLLGAYTVISLIRYMHGYVHFNLLIDYLVAVCVAQCMIALLIDYIPAVKNVVDTYISQKTIIEVEFLEKVNRLYGIGAAVDVAGTRFSIVLIALAAVLIKAKDRPNSATYVMLYWAAFVFIAIVGNMISRTTTIGMVMGLVYILGNAHILYNEMPIENLRLWRTIILVTGLLAGIAMYYYHTDAVIREQLRFGFEGFFNWLEKGEWTTTSTERLNEVMWIWPDADDYKTWIIGKALFSNWHDVGTDIGYCRFVFYSGLLGLFTFSFFFVYNAWVGIQQFPTYRMFFFMLLALSFIIWFKVSTDLFLIYALFLCMDKEGQRK